MQIATLKKEKATTKVPEVKLLGKTFDILEALSKSAEPLSVLALSSLTGINRTTVHRTVQVLADSGYIEPTENTPVRYTIGARILPLAASYLNQNRLRSIALSHLYPLTVKTGHRGHLGIHLHGEVMYLGGYERPQIPSIYTWFGRLAPMHCSSIGKAMLAFMPEAEARAIVLSKPLEKYTDRTITDPEVLFDQLAEIRRTGIAFDHSEHTAFTYCMGVPILSHNLSAMVAISLASRSMEALTAYVEDLKQTAEVISQALVAPRS